MHIAFETKQLRTVCENETEAITKYGVSAAESLMKRLADIRASTGIGDLQAGNLREVPNSNGELMALDLTTAYQLEFAANHPKKRGAPDTPWDKVSRVKIMCIRGTNG